MMHAPIYGYNTIVPEPISTSSEQTPVRTNFNTPEGIYKQSMTVNEYFRANRMPNQVTGPIFNAPVRVSFLRISTRKISSAEEALPSTSTSNAKCNTDENQEGDNSNKHWIGTGKYIERICFNIGREIYVFDYSGISSATESAKPVDKRVYKGTFPTCHDFNKTRASVYSCLLLIGFSAGQIQMIDSSQKEAQNSSKLFNEERQIDRSAVTCLRWVPDGNALFVASHASGNLYLYNEELESPQLAPTYQILKQGEDFTVFSCKTKIARNPMNCWQIGSGAVNMFEFSGATSNFMATVSQDGLLRIFNWRTMELLGCMKSYFGGLLCLAWSPDLRYIATGGEDDMLSLYSVAENQVVCRGQGHRSWISGVAFDHFATFGPSSSSLENDVGGVGYDSTQTDELMMLTPFFGSITTHNENPPCSDFSSLPRHDNVAAMNAGYPWSNDGILYPQASQNGYMDGVGSKKMGEAAQNSTNANCHQPIPSASSMAFSTSTAAGSSSFMVAPTNCSTNGDGNELKTQSRLIYRLGTVGHDCQLCLWDIPEDLLFPATSSTAAFDPDSRTIADGVTADGASPIDPHHPSPIQMNNLRSTTVIPIGIDSTISVPSAKQPQDGKNDTLKSSSDKDVPSKNGSSGGGRFKRLHKRGFSLGSRLTDRSSRQYGTSSNGPHFVDGTLRRGNRLSTHLFGTPQCPRIEEIPVIEPLICKKVANERLGSLHFREDCIVTACQEGYICTWARPNVFNGGQDGRQANLSMSDCPNDCHHPSTDNFASTCV